MWSVIGLAGLFALAVLAVLGERTFRRGELEYAAAVDALVERLRSERDSARADAEHWAEMYRDSRVNAAQINNFALYFRSDADAAREKITALSDEIVALDEARATANRRLADYEATLRDVQRYLNGEAPCTCMHTFNPELGIHPYICSRCLLVATLAAHLPDTAGDAVADCTVDVGASAETEREEIRA